MQTRNCSCITTCSQLSSVSPAETTREPNGDFIVKQGGQVCIRANFKVTFTVKYAVQKKKTVSADTSSRSICAIAVGLY